MKTLVEKPNLYTAKVSVLVDGEVSDVWEHRFGFREFTIKDKDFYLNGKRLYLKATFFEGLYPNGIAHPDSEAMVRDEIRLAKEAGFNMIRPWRRPPAPMWLDIADGMGVLVVGSPALECMRQRGIFFAWTKAVFGEIETEFWGLGESAGMILTFYEARKWGRLVSQTRCASPAGISPSPSSCACPATSLPKRWSPKHWA